MEAIGLPGMMIFQVAWPNIVLSLFLIETVKVYSHNNKIFATYILIGSIVDNTPSH